MKQQKPPSPKIPARWMFALLALAVLYILLQPIANRQFGWNLPSLGSFQKPAAEDKDKVEVEDEVEVESDAEDELLHGVLRSLGREEYVSPAGLRYTRGSAEGHRLRHLERHLVDQPERSGRHGVFNGDMGQFLKHIDQGYLRAKQRQPQTSTHVEDERTIYEATFDKPIGFIGGREGARLRHPSTNKLRVVVDEDRVITAFPY